jgi:protein-S-isoprenylcysteine O-methyltransferase Ste14
VTATIAKIIWLVGGLTWFALRFQPRQHSRETPVRYSGRGPREFILLAASLTGLGVVPFVYVVAHFPRFADYPLVPAISYFGIAVELSCLWLFYRSHRDLGHNWSVSLDLRERHTLVTTGVYALVRHPMYAGFWLMALGRGLRRPIFRTGGARRSNAA